MRIEADVHSHREDRIALVSPYTAKDLIRTLPGARWSKDDGTWSVPLAWTSCLALRDVFGEDLLIGDDLSKWAWDLKRNVIDPALSLREQMEAEGDERLYPFQRAGAEFLRLVKRALLADEMGCVSGDAEITVNRAGGARRITLRKLHQRFHGISGRWDKSVETRTTSMWDDGTLGLNVVEDVMHRGEQSTIRITLESGRQITCTRDHRMSTAPGEWAEAGTLSVGDKLMIDDEAACWFIAHLDTIASIESAGVVDVYDIQMAAPAHSFVADGVVVHNSGKTVQTIIALRKLQDAGQLDGQVLIVCPNTMKRTWERELRTWWGDPAVQIAVISGTAEQRRRKIRSEAKFVVVNWEALRTHSRLTAFGSHALKKCVECGGSGTVKQAQCEIHQRELNEIEFGAVIADECHKAKDPHSAQTRALWAASGDSPIRIGLTGTPIANDPTELWPVLHWMDRQEWPAKTAWVERLIAFTYNLWGGMEVNGIKPTHEAEFHAGLDPHMRRMPKELVLPFLPPIVTERRDIEMSPAQRKAYESMRDTMIARLDAGVLLSANPMVQVGRLMQLASSYGDLRIVKVRVIDKETRTQKIDPVTGEPMWRDEEHLFLTNPSSKLDAFMGDLDDFEGQSVIVFAESRQLIEMLSERLHKKSIRHGLVTGAIDEATRNHTIEEFQRGAFQYILCTIKAGGVGITLTKASVEVFLQRNWSPVDMDQAIARAHRIGSEIHESITVIDYTAPETVEEAQIGALDSKRDMLEEIVRDEEMMRKFLLGAPL